MICDFWDLPVMRSARRIQIRILTRNPASLVLSEWPEN